MAYVKTVWEDNKTPLDAANLNKIEEGVENAMSLAETNEKDIGTLDGQVAAIEVGKQDTLSAGEGISLANNVVKISDNVARTSLTDMGVWVPVQHRPAAEPYWEDMSVSASADANSIAQRNEQGQILTAAPTQDGMAANKKYVDDAAATKQDKLTAGTGIEITSNNVVNVQESTMSTTHMPIGASAEADGIHTAKTLFADGWNEGNGAYLAQTFEDVTPIVAGDGIAFNKHGDKDQMQPEYFDVAVNKNAVPYFPSLDKNKYSLLSWDKAKQDWLTVDFSTEPSALSVARRTTTGQIKCEAPTAAKEAANKAYVDSADAALNTQCTNLAKYLPTFTSWISGANIESKTFDVDSVLYSDAVPKCLVLDLNLNRTGASAGTCIIKAKLDALDSKDPSKKTSQELFNESAEGESGASLVGKIILEHDDEDAYFQWKYIHICYDYYVADQFVKHVDKVKENNSAYYGAQQLVLYVQGQRQLKSNLTKQYANKE